ncbi:hypothetical protein BN1051_03134 [Arthrobacter saudimassiliensis]|uniref:RNA polymerase-associated protein RapA n=1 Tax=Arthrobacter saudimassiliensis TaxID=1461584 RepID=A0A078MY81_9MICC|nr:hypothetical protein BN1051_03134 [Arthrobacter saudimassiliensis]
MVHSPPLVDVQDIIRVVGGAAFQRGQAYARSGAVEGLDWDAAAGVLRARVQGGASVPYRTLLQLERKRQGDYRLQDNHCSCPVGFDCKHVAAVAMQSNSSHVLSRHRPAASEAQVPEWQASLQGLLDGRPPAGAEPAVPLALQFEVRSQPSPSIWGAPKPLGTSPLRLGVRPVVRNKRGNWVKNNLAWSNIAYQTHGLKLDPDQHRWFSQFPALHRATGVTYFGQNDSWLYLDDFANPLLWELLREARRLGIEFVGTRKDVQVLLADGATLSLDVRADDGGGGAPAPLRLDPVLELDGEQYPPERTGTIGSHGVYVHYPEDVVRLAPLDRLLTDQDRALLHGSAALRVPASDAPVFLEKFYPRLRQVLPVQSRDGSVAFPEILPPRLVLAAHFQPEDVLALDWSWEYRQGGQAERLPLLASSGPAVDDGAYRDTAAEADVLEAVRPVLGEAPRPRTLRGVDAAEFTEHLLPRLEKLEDVLVEVHGERPDYRELTGLATLKVTTVESERRDWFDLHIMVRIDGRLVPFPDIFKAIAQGRSKIILPDRSYLSLDRPEFERLHALVAESQTLDEWDTGELGISRYQAGLWSEFEELAEETEEAEAWRAAVGGLLDLAGRDGAAVEPVPLPAGLKAELRPYQQEGFNWLTFLWEHGLGGILGDDMGLGKTLQTLALIAHARQQAPGRPPFLVVAPTSVVPNWVAEAARFVPGLTVQAVPDTSAKSKKPLAEVIAGADVVVTSYAVFRLDFASYRDQPWEGLILDEAQFVKNRTTRAHQCARDLPAPFKLAITGTPMENNLMELWGLFAITAPGLFPSARRFAEEYQRRIEQGGDTERLAQLRRRIRPLLMRRTKEAVAADLPEKQEQVLEIELGPKHRRIYEAHLQRERQKLMGLMQDLDRNRMIVFRSLTLLRMLSLDPALIDAEEYADVGSAKLDVLFEQLEDITAEGHRTLVFSQFTSFLKKAADRLEARGIEYAYLDGSTRDRGEVIGRFKDGAAPVFLISLKAGGFGLNLTEADYVFLLDPWWNPAAENQAVDRTHRIGQHKNVMVYRLVAAGTIEEKVMALKEQKAQLFSSVMDDDGAAFSSALTAEDIRVLLE